MWEFGSSGFLVLGSSSSGVGHHPAMDRRKKNHYSLSLSLSLSLSPLSFSLSLSPHLLSLLLPPPPYSCPPSYLSILVSRVVSLCRTLFAMALPSNPLLRLPLPACGQCLHPTREPSSRQCVSRCSSAPIIFLPPCLACAIYTYCCRRHRHRRHSHVVQWPVAHDSSSLSAASSS